MKRSIMGALVLVSLLGSTPALASPHVIASLGAQPLLGTAKNAAALRAQMEAQPERLKAAAYKLGVQPAEYIQISQRLHAEPVWVVVPRHLDGMAWYANGQTRVERDVVIPADTYGWEAELVEADQVLDVYLPAACGNLSVIRKFRPVVANAKIKPVKNVPAAVAASREQKPPAAPAGNAPASPNGAAPPAPATGPPAATAAAPAPAAAPIGHHRFWPWLAAIGLAFWLNGGGGGGSHSHPFVPPPIITGCPP